MRRIWDKLSDDDEEEELEENVVAVVAILESQRQNLRQPVPHVVRRRARVHRNRVDADRWMMKQYFDYNCMYGPKMFKARFALPRPLFLRVLEQVCHYDQDFLQQTDCCGIPGHTPYMKMIAVMRHFAKGIAPDSLDDYTQMAASTIYMYAKKFMDAICFIYNARYMRMPTSEDTRRLLEENEARGFPGMLGSVDCFHWAWRACPVQEAGQYVGHNKYPTVVLQAVASYDRWIWHSYFGLGGQNNDINVLHASGLFDRELNGVAPPCLYRINGQNYNQGYYLGDGIYPMLGCLVQAYKPSRDNREELFNTYQEAKRKDIERAFGGLKGKFGIIREPCRYYHLSDMKTIMQACLIMHNMCVEVEYRNEEVAELHQREADMKIMGTPLDSLPPGQVELYKKLRNDICLRYGLAPEP